jgi:glycosyltransferase involved in cell wall biosynthesis
MAKILVVSRGLFFRPSGERLVFYENDGIYLRSIGRHHVVWAIGRLVSSKNLARYDFVRSYNYDDFSLFHPVPVSLLSPISVVHSLLIIVRILDKVDLVYIMGPGPGKYLFALMALALGKRIALYNGIHMSVGGMAGVVARVLESTAVRRAKFIIATGNNLVRSYRSMGARIVEPARPIVKVKQAPSTTTPLRSDGVLRVLCIGPINDRKNQIELIRALAHLRDPKRIHCRIVGSGNEQFERQHKDAIALVACQLTFEGHISSPEKLSEIYTQSDVLVLTSSAEGFPRVFYEAGNFGLMIISSNIACGLELVRIDQFAMVYPLGNPVELARLIDGIHVPVKKNPRSLGSRSGEDAPDQFCRLLKDATRANAYLD